MRGGGALVAAVVLSVVACGPGPEETMPSVTGATSEGEGTSPPTAVESTVVAETSGDPAGETDRPFGVVDVFVPGGSSGDRLVVIVPGGGWIDADPAGLVPLAQALADAGNVAVTTTYRASADGAHFPVPAGDVVCAIGSAVEVSNAAGFPADEIVVVGHSAGAHLASLVALRPDDFGADCPAASPAPDRLVGLAGPYDVAQARTPAIELFGPENPDPANWDAGNPAAHAGQRPELDVLLAHGTADDVVPTFFTEAFADALRTAGHDVEEVYIDGADHHSVYSADTAAPLIVDWLDG